MTAMCCQAERKQKEAVFLKNLNNWNKIGQSFSVSDDCIKCEKCVGVCPVQNIKLVKDSIVFGSKMCGLSWLLSQMSSKGNFVQKSQEER